jgi:hypothetical protein
MQRAKEAMKKRRSEEAKERRNERNCEKDIGERKVEFLLDN